MHLQGPLIERGRTHSPAWVTGSAWRMCVCGLHVHVTQHVFKILRVGSVLLCSGRQSCRIFPLGIWIMLHYDVRLI